MIFTSDNGVGTSARILDAIVSSNKGACPAYGADEHTNRAEAALADTFERELAAFLVATGTASNALALGALMPPWGAALCHEHSHIANDECGAPEMLSGGAKLLTIPGPNGKITPAGLRAAIARSPRGVVKQVQPYVLSLSQATEFGTVYSLAEIAALAEIAHAAGLSVHMDGARFANAMATLGCSAADMSWRAGVDALSFGATKNGALACEAVIFFDPARAKDFVYQRKRSGHTLSKGRFLGVQMNAYLAGGHWRVLAAHANAQAARLETGLRSIAGVRLPFERGANEVFAILPRAAHDALWAAGARYYEWGAHFLPPAEKIGSDEIFVRLIASFETSHEDVDRFTAIVAENNRSAVQM